MYRVKLKKIKSNHQNLRSDEIVGFTEELPIQGKPFTMIAKPFAEELQKVLGAGRVIYTTPIKKWRHPNVDGVKDYNKYEIATANSLYELTVLESPKEH